MRGIKHVYFMKTMIYETFNMIFILFVIVIVSDSLYVLFAFECCSCYCCCCYFIFIHFLFNLFFSLSKINCSCFFGVGYSYFVPFIRYFLVPFIYSLWYVCEHLFFHHLSWSHLKLILLTSYELVSNRGCILVDSHITHTYIYSL